MRDGRLIAINVIAIVCVLATAALAANRVEVESATVGKGGTVTIGVYLENDDQLRGVEFPLVFQSQSSGAFPASIAGQYNPAGRLPYGSYPTPLSGLILNNYYDVPDGSCKPGGFATLAGAGGIVASPSNPDMLLFVRQSVFPASPLNPGTDFPIGTGEPSILFDLTVAPVVGSFVIDTTCRDPGGGIIYIKSSGGGVVPGFTAGVITVIDCDCPAQGDLWADGLVGSVDFNELVQVIFFGQDQIQDPACPTARADLNGDGQVDALDLNVMISYLWFLGPKPCNPCNPIEGSCAI